MVYKISRFNELEKLYCTKSEKKKKKNKKYEIDL